MTDEVCETGESWGEMEGMKMTILRLVGIVFLSLVGAYLLLVLHVMVAAYLTDRRMRDAWVHADKDYRHTP